MTIRELRDNLNELMEKHGENVEILLSWDDKYFPGPIKDIIPLDTVADRSGVLSKKPVSQIVLSGD